MITMRSLNQLVSCLGILVTIPLTLSCSIPMGGNIKDYSLEETMSMAPIVVSGKDVKHTSEEYHGSNYTFQVNCVFKSGNLTVPRTLFLLNIGSQTTCDGSGMEVGSSYLVSLMVAPREEIVGVNENYTGVNPDLYFMEYKPDVYNSGVFKLTSEVNLDDVSALCGMDESITSYNNQDGSCPMRQVTVNNCKTPTSASFHVLLPYKLLFSMICAVIFAKRIISS